MGGQSDKLSLTHFDQEIMLLSRNLNRFRVSINSILLMSQRSKFAGLIFSNIPFEAPQGPKKRQNVSVLL